MSRYYIQWGSDDAGECGLWRQDGTEPPKMIADWWTLQKQGLEHTRLLGAPQQALESIARRFEA